MNKRQMKNSQNMKIFIIEWDNWVFFNVSKDMID